MYLRQYTYALITIFLLSSYFLFAESNNDEEFYILPDFVVTDDDDKGYYSANTLAGTRTNELTKNIPMTISTVNAEMIEDFKMKTLEDLGNFVPSIEAEGNVYNNQEIRFRGLLTRNQLYEFMPRYSPLDWYNVGRSDIIRGANSLIYGQADPGGKVNVLSKTASFNKNKGSVSLEIGNKDWTKFTYDENILIGDKSAVRFMFVDKYREFDANYKFQEFTGGTIEFAHILSPKTRFRLHLERGNANRSLIGGTFKVGQTPVGLPNGIVADPKLADLMSDDLFQEIKNYSVVNPFDGSNYDSIYPYSNSDTDPEGNSFNYGFIDLNSNGILEKNFTDANFNNSYDREAPIMVWIDGNEDGIINITEPFEYNDVNGNGNWDGVLEPFATVMNGQYDVGELFDNPKNGVYDIGEIFADLDQDGLYGPGDLWFEATMDGSGDFQPPEEFTDLNSNGIWDIGEEFTDTNQNSVYDVGATFTDSGDYSLESLGWTESDNVQTEFNSNGDALFSYIDKNGNGKFDYLYNPNEREFVAESTEDFAFIDSDNDGKWDPTNELITSWTDSNNNGTLDYDDNSDQITPTSTNKLKIDEQTTVETWTPKDEDFDDLNNNGVYDDSDYASGGLMVRATSPNIWGFTPSGGSLVPDFIRSREDIRNLFRGIDYSNSGTGFGPDSFSRKRFDFVLADLDHVINDELSVKVSLAYEDLFDTQLSSGWSANQINFSSGYNITVRIPTLRSLNEYYSDENNSKIVSPYEAVLVDLTNANYAHLILENIENNGLESVREDLKLAMDDWASNEWNGSFSSLTAEAISKVDRAEDEVEKDGIASNNEIVDYWVDSYLDLSDADTELEKLYELAKFGGRVQNFLKESHSNYYQNNGYSYLWGFSGMGDPLYNALTNTTLGAPEDNAIAQIFELDRYINVPRYREQIRDWDLAESIFQDSKYEDLEIKYQDDSSFLAKGGKYEGDDPEIINLSQEDDLYIDFRNFTLNEDGERLIYDAIPVWLLKGDTREMKALDQVELYDINTFNLDNDSLGYDSVLNINNDKEVELQRRAIAKMVYSFLVEEIEDPNSDSEFWDATKKIYDFFKYELHHKNDFSWMWEQKIQPTLLLKIDAVVEDENYLTDEKNFVDFNGDGIKDETLPSVLKSSGEILEPFIKRQWKHSTNRDQNKSVRITFNNDLPRSKLIPGKQNLLLGIDLDKRKASRSEEQLVSKNVRTWGDIHKLYLRSDILSDYVSLSDIIEGSEGESAFFNFNIDGHKHLGAPNWIANNRIPFGEQNVAQWADVYYADATVESKGLWLAASGSYNKGKLRTLFGIRRDHINAESEYSRYTLRAQKSSKDDELETVRENKSNDINDVIYCPSVGALYWLTKNLAIFGNYSESVISPTGFQYDVFGDITPPETGQGKEIGFKLSSSDNVINGQLTLFSIDKKNEQRQNISWPMLTSIYPAKDENGFIRTEPYENGYLPTEIYDFIPYETRLGAKVIDDETGAEQVRAIFNPKGYRVADEEVRSEGLELDLYYNPNRNISLFLGYAYLETKILKSALSVLEGLPTAGTSDHNINFTFKYSFKQGKLKGLQLGMNQKYRSAALLSHYFVDLDGDNQADYIPVKVEDKRTGEKNLMEPRHNTLWLEDQHSTDVFIKWAGKIKKHFPYTVFQLNLNNLFDNKNLISTGLNNARYTEGRNITLSAGLYF